MRTNQVLLANFVIIVAAILVVPHELRGSDVRAVAKKAIPATVIVEFKSVANEPNPDSSGDVATSVNSINQTTGTIVSKKGLIVTYDGNPDRGAEKIVVTLNDNKKVEGKLRVVDRRSGLKLIKVDAGELHALKPANKEVEIGEPAVFCDAWSSRESHG